MAARTVRAGFIVYTGADKRPVTGYFGDEVDVHKDDLERFDRLNPVEVEVETVENTDDESSTEEPYKGVTVADLKVDLDKRNEGREDDKKIVPAEPGNRPEIVAALVADDEAGKQ